ncbi:hypothetical protein DYB30_012669 [Aphanomyces astaci]|uniref:FAD-binding FR-type domain-containing protein n=1 Tax=Aphanomyces astaci TaxID=112090 RepID=A0A397E9K4_APHAT|nr:hypothetical protein DYB30_012669 [Aphanomyces astaci]
MTEGPVSQYVGATTPKQSEHLYAFSANNDPPLHGSGLSPRLGHLASASPTSRVFGILGHGIVGLLLVLAVLTPAGYNFPLYAPTFSTPMSTWWGVNPKVKGSGHSEMVVPTYFFLGTVLPVLVAGVLFALVQVKAPVGAPSPLSPFLHRKPKLFKSMLSYGEILFIAVIVTVNVLVFNYQFVKRYKPTNTTADTFKNVGTALGFTGLFDMVLVALPATRHSFWMEWLDIPYAHGVKYHKWIGVLTIVAFVAHTVCFVVYYAIVGKLYKLLPCVNCDMATDGMANWEYFFGILSMACFVVMGATSLPYVRRHHYTVFYATHFLFIPATLFAVFHWGNIIYFLFTSIVLYVGNRMLSQASIVTPVSLTRAVQLSSDVVELSFECATGYSPGDAVWIKVPALSKTQWHPFSVASTPLETPDLLTIYVKNLGSWTAGLHEYIGQCQEKNVQPVIYMDGGYTSAAPIPATHSDVVFIGGGIGITPLMGQLLHILRSHPTQNAWLIWNVRRKDMLVAFQSWLHHIEVLGGSRLKIRLHVTQDDTTSFDLDTHDDKPRHARYVDGHVAVESRPYSHVSTFKRVWMLLLAFGFSGGLLVAVTFGNKIQSNPPRLWLLQRFVQFCVVVLGCFLAYWVIKYANGRSSQHQLTGVVSSSSGGRDGKVHLNADEMTAHFNVQTGRANLADLFHEIEASRVSTVGVYVSGPMSLIHAVDLHGQGISKFHIRHEVFEL